MKERTNKVIDYSAVFSLASRLLPTLEHKTSEIQNEILPPLLPVIPSSTRRCYHLFSTMNKHRTVIFLNFSIVFPSKNHDVYGCYVHHSSSKFPFSFLGNKECHFLHHFFFTLKTERLQKIALTSCLSIRTKKYLICYMAPSYNGCSNEGQQPTGVIPTTNSLDQKVLTVLQNHGDYGWVKDAGESLLVHWLWK